MNIIKNNCYTKQGFDFRVDSEVSIIKCMEIYFVVKVTTISGFLEDKQVITTDPTNEYNGALLDYYRLIDN